MALIPLPTPIPPPPTVPPSTRPPTTPLPTTEPFSEAERVELVRTKLYEKVNCWRAEGGMGPVPYLYEWQALADEYARAWRDHYLAHGPEGFDSSPWRSQLQAAGGDGVPDTAGLVLYAPDYYSNTAPKAKWETFDMCDPSVPVYGIFAERQFNTRQISGAAVGLASWWNGDIFKAAVVVVVKW
jgi:hypothetical protein